MKITYALLPLLFPLLCLAQIPKQDSATHKEMYIAQPLDSIQPQVLKKNPLKAALYSAVLPGLGQVYNKRYWKVPIVWGVIGTGVGITLWYQDKYTEYRSAYIAELNNEPHKYKGVYSKEVLAEAQDFQKRNRDYAIALTIVAYALNVLDATVDAHLFEIKKDKDLEIKPVTIYNPAIRNLTPGIGLTLNFK